jgi:hypothetical protein
MAPFKMLYGRICRTPLFWNETGEHKVFRPDILEEAEKQVHTVRERFRVMQLRQKSYADHRRRELSFEVGDFVYLKVSPMRGLRRFKVRGKLAPRFIRPFKILEKRGEVAYQLELPPQLSDITIYLVIRNCLVYCLFICLCCLFPITTIMSRRFRESPGARRARLSAADSGRARQVILDHIDHMCSLSFSNIHIGLHALILYLSLIL